MARMGSPPLGLGWVAPLVVEGVQGAFAIHLGCSVEDACALCSESGRNDRFRALEN
jgi:hypothetical protein